MREAIELLDRSFVQDLRPDHRDLWTRTRLLRMVRGMDHDRMSPDTEPTTRAASPLAALDDTLLTFAWQCRDEADHWLTAAVEPAYAAARCAELRELASMARLMHQMYVDQGAPAMDSQHVRDGLAAGARFLETLEAQRYAMAPPTPEGDPQGPAHGMGG